MLMVLQACGTPAVGAPCLPEQIPDNGFDPREAYIESSSVQCETRVCMVYKLEGDPQEGCSATPTKKCPTPAEVERSIYCTCRCDSGSTGFAECECPDGFSCVEVLNKGGPGVRGGYCVRSNSVSGG
jgi:hypothetical protein